MLPIAVRTEDDEVREGIAAQELEALLRRIGGPGDHYVVATRLPDQEDIFLQVWHEPDEGYAVEFRDGSPEQFQCVMTEPGPVVEVFLTWAADGAGGAGWRDGHDWRPVDVTGTPELDPETREQAEEFALPLVHGGFMDMLDIADEVADGVDTGERPLTREEATAIVGGLWAERLREQEGWPEVTDPDRVEAAFAGLARQGLTARMDFACCSRCGQGEIRGEARESDHGYVFFHHQDTRSAAAGHGLCLRYGTYDGSDEETRRIGEAVAAAMRAQELPVVWDGSPDSTVQVTPLTWLKRLPREPEYP
jgi:hypothetical protein